MGLSANLFVSAEQLGKRTAQEIFDKYGKIGQQEYQRLEQSNNYIDKQQKAFIDQSRQEWKQREENWKKNQSHIAAIKKHDIMWSESLDKNQKRIDVLHSWSPTILSQRLFNAKGLRAQQEEAIFERKKALYGLIGAKYNHEARLSRAHRCEKHADFCHIKNHKSPGIIQHLNAFIKSLGLNKRDQQLFHEYHEQQLKE